jgi:hypothetical protein
MDQIQRIDDEFIQTLCSSSVGRQIIEGIGAGVIPAQTCTGGFLFDLPDQAIGDAFLDKIFLIGITQIFRERFVE